MALVPHKITALAESDAQGTSGKNIVVGAVVCLYEPSGSVVTLFDNEAGANGSTTKQADATGQVVVYVTAGEYDEEVNGSVKRRVTVGGNGVTSYGTTAELQSSRPNKTGQRAENRERANAQYTLSADGYTALPGDITAANGRVWVLQSLSGTALPYYFLEWFGVTEAVNNSSAVQGAINRFTTGGTLKVSGMYNLGSPINVQYDDFRIEGSGRGSGFNASVDIVGNLIVVESSDPTTTTIFRFSMSDIELKSTVSQSAGALLKVTEAAYCTFQNISIQNGFIGFHGKGLRASEIDLIHIRSGQLYASVQTGSRFMLLEDSPRPTVGENVELLLSNFNFATNGSAFIEYGLEVKEADGIWFDSGHIRGADLANCFLNASSSPQLLGLKFDNVWFDGATKKCLLIAGTPTGYAGFIVFSDCFFTGGSVNGVHIQAGTVIDWVEFNNCSTWQIDNQIAWRIETGNNVIINSPTFKAINASNAVLSSAIVAGADVESIVINGGSIFNSPNLANGISINSGVNQATINGVAFRGLPLSTKAINLSDPVGTIYNSSGCTTDKLGGYVTGNAQFGEFNSVLTDSAVSVSIGEVTGCTLSVGLKLNLGSHGLIALETQDPANIAVISGGANLAVTTGILTGTTGAVGKLTVSVTDDGVLYFENRTGVTRSVVWKILNRSLA